MAWVRKKDSFLEVSNNEEQKKRVVMVKGNFKMWIVNGNIFSKLSHSLHLV